MLFSLPLLSLNTFEAAAMADTVPQIPHFGERLPESLRINRTSHYRTRSFLRLNALGGFELMDTMKGSQW